MASNMFLAGVHPSKLEDGLGHLLVATCTYVEHTWAFGVSTGRQHSTYGSHSDGKNPRCGLGTGIIVTRYAW